MNKIYLILATALSLTALVQANSAKNLNGKESPNAIINIEHILAKELKAWVKPGEPGCSLAYGKMVVTMNICPKA